VKYRIVQQSCKAENKPSLKSAGVLVFDEVKVVLSLMRNSRSHRIVGLAMTASILA